LFCRIGITSDEKTLDVAAAVVSDIEDEGPEDMVAAVLVDDALVVSDEHAAAPIAKAPGISNSHHVCFRAPLSDALDDEDSARVDSTDGVDSKIMPSR
jgi:hypothetical protein